MTEQSQVPPEVARMWANLHETAAKEIRRLESETRNEKRKDEQMKRVRRNLGVRWVRAVPDNKNNK